MLKFGKRLRRNFYLAPTLEVAKSLLGKYLVVRPDLNKPNYKLIGKILETEAYIGPMDKAAHSYKGKTTERNKIEYIIGGHVYIYLVYGMYWQLNITTGNIGKPECVLIRAVEPVLCDKNAIPSNIANGPGKLCKYFKLDKSFYGEDLCYSKRIMLTTGVRVAKKDIIATKRIGIDYAGPFWANKKWRFILRSKS